MGAKGPGAGQDGRVPAFDIVMLAASLGGLKAISTVLAGLPGDFPAAVTVAQHRAPTPRSHFRALLQPRTALAVVDAGHGDPLYPGAVYLAPAGNHLIVQPDGRLALTKADRQGMYRPSADLLFASAADVYGPRAIGVVLTGRQQDGATGAWTLKAMGGRVLAQDPATCEAADMPLAAIRSGAVDFVAPIDQIAKVLVTLVMAPGAAPLFQVPPRTSLSRARRLWSAPDAWPGEASPSGAMYESA